MSPSLSQPSPSDPSPTGLTPSKQITSNPTPSGSTPSGPISGSNHHPWPPLGDDPRHSPLPALLPSPDGVGHGLPLTHGHLTPDAPGRARLGQLLDQWTREDWLRPLDRAFARFLGQEVADAHPLALLAAALASHQLGRGHACLDLEATLRDPGFALSLPPEDAETTSGEPPPHPAALLAGLTLTAWRAALGQPSLIGQGAGDTPLVLAGSRLYLRRYWDYERAVRERIAARLAGIPAQLTGTEARMTGSEALLTGTETQRTDTETQGTGTDAQWLGTEAQRTDTETQRMGIEVQQSGTETQRMALPDTLLRQTLDRLFPTSPIHPDWQKLACALAAPGAFSVITGGPGTGKTTTVVRLLALLQTLALTAPAPGKASDKTPDKVTVKPPRPLRIRLAAPTGKAAARLNEAIAGAVASLPLAGLPQAEAVRASIPVTVTTLHRLLGSRPDTRRLRHHAGNPLALDVLVIDEASMIDLEMMAAVLAALPPSARLILLGDKDQLASVEAGAVLGQICQRAAAGHYTPATRDWLETVTGESLPRSTAEVSDNDGLAAARRECPMRPDAVIGDGPESARGECQASPGEAIPDRTDPATAVGEDQKDLIDPAGTALDQAIVMLRHSHRFAADSGIGQLAAAVNAGSKAVVRAIWSRGYRDLALIVVANKAGTALEHRDVATAGLALERRDTFSEHPDTSYEHRDACSENLDAPCEKRDFSPEHPAPPHEHRDACPKHPAVPNEHRNVPDGQVDAALRQLLIRGGAAPSPNLSGPAASIATLPHGEGANARPPRVGYRHYLEVLRQKHPPTGAATERYDDWARAVLAAQGQFQVLCALRRGPWGVAGLNETIARLLREAGLIPASSGWYLGRPVLVTRNDYALGLMNGDIGVTLARPAAASEPERLRVAFPAGDGRQGIRWVLPSRLQAVETVFALTVHKSQGSEFTHAALVLPDKPSPILTRELLYTGITRARHYFTLVRPGDERVLEQAIERRVLRASGLLTQGD